ncbi:Glutathione biosynthesis bifunctional protein GshAB [Capillimicrobium parvum]|uniref:Glutathione biosynthesis bifunctional protein GshAB n=1 Tax=Capillimicrobium parvum TaxID=2884022 RepID=A0A9E6XUU5_9ACTN|nr:Glutathione biosynthesis bifunctional protein GshAB [Capillimicrobium parvum]
MTARDTVALRALQALTATQRGRDLAPRLDLLRGTGVRHVVHRMRHGLHRGEIAPGVKHAVYRRIWSDAAAALGADILEELPGGILEIGHGPARTRVFEQTVALDDAVTLRLAIDKRTVHQLLLRARVPVPVHRDFTRDDPARGLEFLAREPGPCVVKAATGTGGGDGTTCGVRTAEDLTRAAMRAGRRSDTLLIERQARGSVYRLLFLDDRLLDVVCQSSPTVDGDGTSTVEELIRAENRRRARAGGADGIYPLRVDLDCLLTLSHAGLALGSVPAAGARCTVKIATNEARVEDCRTARDELCDAIVEDAHTAVRTLGVRLAGVDLVTADPSRPLRETGGVINEVNGTPALHRHYQVSDRQNLMPVAEPVLAYLLGIEPDEPAAPARFSSSRVRA